MRSTGVCPSQIRFTQGTQPPLSPGLEALVSTPEPVLPDEQCPKPGELSKCSHSLTKGHPVLGSIPPTTAVLLLFGKCHYSSSDLSKAMTKSTAIMLHSACLGLISQKPWFPHAEVSCSPMFSHSAITPTTPLCSLLRNSLEQVTSSLCNVSISHPGGITKLLK